MKEGHPGRPGSGRVGAIDVHSPDGAVRAGAFRNDSQGFGFIEQESGPDVFAHYNSILSGMSLGLRLSYSPLACFWIDCEDCPAGTILVRKMNKAGA